MDEDNQQPNRHKTLDDVREERLLERIAAVNDPAMREGLDQQLQERENSLAKMKETQKENRPLHEQQVVSQRLSPASTAPAEVTRQEEGQLRGEASRHNKLINDELQRHDEIYGKDYNEIRYSTDRMYRQVIDQELEREHTNRLRGPDNPQGPQASLEGGKSQEQQHPQVAIDYGRFGSDTNYRHQVLINEEEVRHSPTQLPDAHAHLQQPVQPSATQELLAYLAVERQTQPDRGMNPHRGGDDMSATAELLKHVDRRDSMPSAGHSATQELLDHLEVANDNYRPGN